MFPLASILALSTVATAANTRGDKRRSLKGKKAKKTTLSHHNADYQDHYLVGLLNYPNDAVPEELDGHTSGTYIGDMGGAPFDYVPSVGFSDIEPAYRRRNGSWRVLLFE